MKVVALPTMMFGSMLADALCDGVLGVALVDHHGRTIESNGELEAIAMPLAALVMKRHETPKARLFAGEVLSTEIEGGYGALGVARRRLYVVAIVRDLAAIARIVELRARVDELLAEDVFVPPRGGGGDGGGSDELRLVELGLTVPRVKA